MNPSVACVIPVYNNASTVADVARRARLQVPTVLVIDDGSTDADLSELLRGCDVELVRHETNRGKGAAILTALEALHARGFDYMITLDADGQHFPEDIPLFLPFLMKNDYSLLIGCRDFSSDNVPNASKFGRKLSNFWMRIETGIDVRDCQSGFRVYPVKYLTKIRCLSRHYNFETEILTRAAWANLELINVPIRVHYPKPDERISHFHRWKDNFRISLIHAHLVARKLLLFPHKKLRVSDGEKPLSIFRPKELFFFLLRENATPRGLAKAAALGTVLAVIPIPGFHSAAILYFATLLRLNKIMAFNIQHLYMPPLTPFLCIELGYFLRHGSFLTELTFQTLIREMPLRIGEWLLGSLILAPVFALLAGLLVYAAAAFYRNLRRRTHEPPLEP